MLSEKLITALAHKHYAIYQEWQIDLHEYTRAIEKAAREEAIRECADWYAECGWGLDEDDVPIAMLVLLEDQHAESRDRYSRRLIELEAENKRDRLEFRADCERQAEEELKLRKRIAELEAQIVSSSGEIGEILKELTESFHKSIHQALRKRA
jgi:hypothetical protein